MITQIERLLNGVDKYNRYTYNGYMSKVVLNIKTDKEVKEEAQKTARELGVPLSTVVNAYLKEFVREKAFSLSLTPQIRPEVEKLLRQAHQDYKNKKNVSRVFTSATDALKYLHS